MGDVLVGIKQIHADASETETAVFIFDGEESPVAVGGSTVAGLGRGGDPASKFSRRSRTVVFSREAV